MRVAHGHQGPESEAQLSCAVGGTVGSLGGASPHSRPEVFSTPGKESFPKAQPWRMGSFPQPCTCSVPRHPHLTHGSSSGFCSKLHSTSGMGHSTPLKHSSAQDRGAPCQSPRHPQDRGMWALCSGCQQPSHVHSYSHSHRLASLGLKTTFSSMVAQRVQETRRTEEWQFGRDISGEERWECPEQRQS